MKSLKEYDNIYERLIVYIDSLNLLVYVRDDISVDSTGKKMYYRSICINIPINERITDSYDRCVKSIYISTQCHDNGVSDRNKLAKAFCETYIAQMKNTSVFSNYPKSLKSLFANSFEELVLKMGIIGI